MSENTSVEVVKFSRKRYLDKVEGCWMGKNIGGTLGAPVEGWRCMHDISFYLNPTDGKPLANDDLDLQLVWLIAAEDKGICNVNERVLGEYWLDRITGPWNEYGVCKANIRNGLTPPLSGSCNNERWHGSNGAWIRSEIWACIFPGSPDRAAKYAYFDSCCDHSGDGIYAELFTASLESLAFVVDDIPALIRLALRRIPEDCRVARAVRLAQVCFDKEMPFVDARNAVLADSEDLGWFQAPANVAFVVLALLYGKRDFGRTVCLAVNCGDDTDCTGGTAGAILGILLGRSNLPEKWTAPIGSEIVTGSINSYIGYRNAKDVGELTHRVARLAEEASLLMPSLPRFSDADADGIPGDYTANIEKTEANTAQLWTRDPNRISFDLPCGVFSCSYEHGPYAVAGRPLRLTFRFQPFDTAEKLVSFRLELPETWTAQPSDGAFLHSRCDSSDVPVLEITPGTLSGAYVYVPVKIQFADRLVPYCVLLPFQCGESRNIGNGGNSEPFAADARADRAARRS